MKQLLRLVLSRKQYRALRTAMRTADAVSEATNSTEEPSGSQSSTTRNERRQQLTANPNIPTDGPVETPAQLKAVLQQMDPYEFEHFVADLWERMGWETSVSTESADKGIDITAQKSTPYEQLVLIQAKRYGPNTTVGSPEIQQYASLKHQQSGVDKVLMVTTNAYTQQACELAEQLNVKLIDGDDLVGLIDQQDAGDLVATYLDFIEHTPEADTEPTVAVEDDAPASAATQTDTAPTTTEPAEKSAVASTVWHKLVAVATGGWIVLFVGAAAMPEVVFGLVFFVSWIGLPLGISLDSRRLPEGWPTHTWAYVLGSLVWFVAIVPGAVYLWRRRSVSD